MSVTCPAGHASDESDYCSVCGAAIPAASLAPTGTRPGITPRPPASTAGTAKAQAPHAGACPVCGEPRSDPDGRFCEVCRYDFVARTGGPPPAAPPAPAPAPTPAPTPALTPAPGARRWVLVVTIDPTLDTDPDPAVPPPTEPERLFPVEQAEMLVGRRDDKQNIRPAIPLHDPGASRRHARFLLGADGVVSLHDLASTNGTQLNGKDVVSGSVTPLAVGDQVTLGRWTRIRLEARG